MTGYRDTAWRARAVAQSHPFGMCWIEQIYFGPFGPSVLSDENPFMQGKAPDPKFFLYFMVTGWWVQ